MALGTLGVDQEAPCLSKRSRLLTDRFQWQVFSKLNPSPLSWRPVCPVNGDLISPGVCFPTPLVCSPWWLVRYVATPHVRWYSGRWARAPCPADEPSGSGSHKQPTPWVLGTPFLPTRGPGWLVVVPALLMGA